MAKKPVSTIPPQRLAAYEALVTALPGVERKGATMPYTSLNGHMFSFLDKNGQLGLRLPPETRETFLKKHKSRLCEAHGTVLKEYVLVPEALFAKKKELAAYFADSLRFVQSLKPKTNKKGG